MSTLEERLRSAATRMPGPYRSDAEESGPNEVRVLVQQAPADGEAAAILGSFLESGSVDEARLAATLAGEMAIAPAGLLAGYRRSDLPTHERSKLAWVLGKALVEGTVALAPEISRWVQDRNDGAAFWGAYFLRDRQGFEREAAAQLARDAVEAGNQLWFAATLLRDSEYDAFLEALEKLEPHFGNAWVQAVLTTMAAVRQGSAPADHAEPARA